MTRTFDAIIIGAGISGVAIGLVLSDIIDACENGHDHDRNPVEVKLRNIDFTLNSRSFIEGRKEGSSLCCEGNGCC